MTLFYHKSRNGKGSYLFSASDKVSDSDLEGWDSKKTLCLPIAYDTEFTQYRRELVTAQFGDYELLYPKIFASPKLASYCIKNKAELRHSVLKHDFYLLDYLESLGYECKLEYTNDICTNSGKVKGKDKKSKTRYKNSVTVPNLDIYLYGHFLLAELMLLGKGRFRDDLLKLVASKSPSYCITQEKRLRAIYGETSDIIPLKARLVLNGKRFNLRLRFIDTIALHGSTSYFELGKNTNVPLIHKNDLTPDDKSDMMLAYISKPIEYDNYAIGDLYSHKMLENNSDMMLKLHHDLGISDYFKEPKLTLGKTVSELFTSSLLAKFGIPSSDKTSRDFIEGLCKTASAQTLKTKIDNTSSYLSKVHGGRINNNNPLLSYVEGSLADIDIESAYGTALRFQTYPIGNPTIECLPISKYNRHKSLRQWLNARKYFTDNSELVNGLWVALINIDNLKYPQDFIPSWFNFEPSDICKMVSDHDKDSEIDPKKGRTKILTSKIINGVITSDILEIILNCCNDRQKTEILDKSIVVSSIYYPSYARVNTYAELVESYKNWDGENTVESERTADNKTKTTNTNSEPNQWIGVNLGDLLVDKLIAYRKFYKLIEGDKCPMQTLFKLITNTLYGDFCSPFFKVSNVVVGNNITARCRTGIWALEKCLNPIQTITDGGCFNLNKVVYSKTNPVTATNTFNLYQEKDLQGNRGLELRPLGGYAQINLIENCSKLELIAYDGQVTIIDNPTQWVNENAFNHIKNTFNLSIYHNEYKHLSIDVTESVKQKRPVIKYAIKQGLYGLMVKEFYNQGYFHGMGNYFLLSEKLDNESKLPINFLAYRSYENGGYQAYNLNDDSLTTDPLYDGVTPAQYFLSQLNKDSISRGKAFTKNAILKIKEYRAVSHIESNRYASLRLVPGDTIQKAGLHRELSLSQLKYKNDNQLLSIESEANSLKRKYGQSYEIYFINDDGSLRYGEMIKTIDKLISQGCEKLNPVLDKSRHKHRLGDTLYHPELDCLEFLKENSSGEYQDDFITDDSYFVGNDVFMDDDFML